MGNVNNFSPGSFDYIHNFNECLILYITITIEYNSLFFVINEFIFDMSLKLSNINHIVINDLQDETFYADIILNTDWQQLKIDARPSDAIALALRVESPIYVTEDVLDKAGIIAEHDIDEYTIR